MSAVLEAIEACRSANAAGGEPWRGLLGHAGWQRPATAAPRLLLFSSPDALKRCDAFTPNVACETVAGLDVFLGDLSGLDAVTVDPGSPHELVIAQPDFAVLKELAEAIEIEAAWQRLRHGRERTDDLQRVVRYPGYRLTAVETDGAFLLIHVPHDNDEMFVPIFTHADAHARALPSFERQFSSSRIKTVVADGLRVFPPLAKETAAGFVLNHLGPPEPAAFRLGVIDLLIEAANTPQPIKGDR